MVEFLGFRGYQKGGRSFLGYQKGADFVGAKEVRRCVLLGNGDLGC